MILLLPIASWTACWHIVLLHFGCPKFESRLNFYNNLFIYFYLLSILECGREGHCKCMEHMTLSHMSVVPHCHSWCFCRKLVSRQACLFIIKAVTPLTAVRSAWHFLFAHKFCIPPSPMIYQRSSLFIQNASLNHLPLASFISEVLRPAEPKLHILSTECVLLTPSHRFQSCLSLSPLSLITLSQPSEHRYHTFVAIEILFPFPKAVCATYQGNLGPNPEESIDDLCGGRW